MAKVHFHFSTMNAGKSTSLLQSNHNYQVRDLKTFLFTPEIDAAHHDGLIHSRIGLSKEAIVFATDFNFYKFIETNTEIKVSCILIDEAQFLTQIQVKQLCRICDEFNIPVMCYGIRTDFQGNLFEGSAALLAYADTLIELKTLCQKSKCSRKATMVARLDQDGNIVTEGAQIQIGGEQYKVYCRKHFRKLTGLI